MQTPTDSIISPFHNYGNSTQHHSSSRTPRQIAEVQRPSTLSPLSRGKKWTEKLARFQKSSGKKKRFSPSPASSSTFSFSPKSRVTSSNFSGNEDGNMLSTPSSVSADHLPQHPYRTSSLPRPNSNLFYASHNDWSGASEPPVAENSNVHAPHKIPPKIAPFGYPIPRTASKKSFLNAACTLCDEPISSRRKGEKIIELTCGHLSHQECLIISFGTNSKADVGALFPLCTKCKENANKAVQCIPKNDELKDLLISDFLIHKIPDSELPTTSQSQFPLSSSLLPPFGSSYTPVERQTIYSQAPNLSPNLILAAPPKDRNQIPQKYPKRPFLHIPSGHRRTISNTSSIFTMTSMVSSANDSVSIISDSMQQRDDETKIPLPLLRSYFIQVLLNNFQDNLQDWKIDGDYGLLRLVDKLMVSEDGQKYLQCWCFLFENALVVAEVDGEDVDVLEIRLKNLEIFTPVSCLKMTTLEASVLKCTLNKEDCSTSSNLYIVEKINSDESTTVQKWISALLNHDFVFDEDNITSTLPILPILRNFSDSGDSGEHETSTFLGLINPNKVVEVGNMNHENDTVIIRRGFTLGLSESSAQSSVNTIQSVLTTISSILSLKREKPDNLVIILQVDFKKIEEERCIIVIYNSLKALLIKFPRLQFCFVDRNNNVLDYGSVSHKVDSLSAISNLVSKRSLIQFSPTWLKNTLYPEEIHEHLGIISVSNSNMEADKSVLFQDYKCFTCLGRRRPNELRVKVGYLNVDYSDRINELVEVGSWNLVLETLCYSFSLSFDEDEEDENDDNSTENDFDRSLRSLSDAESTTTIHIDSPFGNGNLTINLADDGNPYHDIEHCNVNKLESVVSATESPLFPNVRLSLYSNGEDTNESDNSVSALLLSDMDRRIGEITRRGSISSLIESGNETYPLHMDYI
ncbi:Ste5p [Saccharomyces cerevisiae x Saccharomyces kudriavzevii VIN7]|uniref:Ste5p n=1 Tax=Saccharomyces cerevisiae x Saccharomyces kudriavzevii (strain VIN7) TaxID=1095631 RepID=H0GSQ3_SACCK|nr:Ste5p [Saccharomyces cerevisiae x Saccharomyces kudriavzevii VIN7]